MAWVRYDDGFHDHDKTAAVRHECPEALALHVLANTWTSRSTRPGFVPAAVPFTLIGSRSKAKRWADVLVRAGFWVVVDGGWEFVNHARYRAPETRQTPGTPADLSEKRAAAGRRGGVASASRRQANEQPNAAANQANASSNGKQPSSKRCSPVVASNEATPEPEPVPTTSALAARATDPGTVVAAFIDGATSNGMSRPGPRIVGQVAKAAGALLGQGQDPDALITAARRLGANGWDNLEREVRRVEAERHAPPEASTATRAAQTLALAAQLEAAEGARR